MEANRSRSRWTWSEFARLESTRGERHEIIGGELAVTPAPGRTHQRLVTDLSRILGNFVHDHALGELLVGPFDVLLGDGDFLEPDLVFIRKSRTGLITERGVEGAPDLVIEVLSPSTVHRDRGVKLERYRYFGVPIYWIVDPEAASVEVWRLASEEAPETIGAGALLRWTLVADAPPLEIDVAALFAALRP